MGNVVLFTRPGDLADSEVYEPAHEPSQNASAALELVESLRRGETKATGCVTVAVYQLERAVIRLRQSAKLIAKGSLRDSLGREIVRIETALGAVKDHLRRLE
jgi:hypothetical protein